MIKISGCPNCHTTFKKTYEIKDSDKEEFIYCMYCHKGFLVSKHGIKFCHDHFEAFKDILK